METVSVRISDVPLHSHPIQDFRQIRRLNILADFRLQTISKRNTISTIVGANDDDILGGCYVDTAISNMRVSDWVPEHFATRKTHSL